MRYGIFTCALLLAATAASAQVASHTPTLPAAQPPTQSATLAPTDKPVARVNGIVLTDRDLLREMYTIFPYARQHNGFPKSQEASIRQGALEMIIFEELVYQDAVKRGITIPAAQVSRGEAEFLKQFSSPDEFDAYLKSEMHGSRQYMRKQVERSLMIDKVLKTDVQDRSAVTLAEAKAYYLKNPSKFEQPDSFTFQSISIVPPYKATPDQEKNARARADAAFKQAKAAKDYQSFGLLAEKLSEDDFRVNMGEHKQVTRDKLPPQIIKALLAMRAGDVSNVIQIETAFTIVRLDNHTPAHKLSFDQVKDALRTQLQKEKYDRLRSELAKKLRANAKIEVV